MSDGERHKEEDRESKKEGDIERKVWVRGRRGRRVWTLEVPAKLKQKLTLSHVRPAGC